MVFQAFGGLRGAVGISLAIYLDNIVRANFDGTNSEYIVQSNKFFGMVGGVAFLSLIVNGSLAGPLLHYLGLSDASETRKKMLETYREQYCLSTIESLVKLLGDKRFHKVSFPVLRHHVLALQNVSKEESKCFLLQRIYVSRYINISHICCVETIQLGLRSNEFMGRINFTRTRMMF